MFQAFCSYNTYTHTYVSRKSLPFLLHTCIYSPRGSHLGTRPVLVLGALGTFSRVRSRQGRGVGTQIKTMQRYIWTTFGRRDGVGGPRVGDAMDCEAGNDSRLSCFPALLGAGRRLGKGKYRLGTQRRRGGRI